MFVFACCCVKKCTINLIELIFLLNHIYLLTKRSFEEKSNKYNYAVVLNKNNMKTILNTLVYF